MELTRQESKVLDPGKLRLCQTDMSKVKVGIVLMLSQVLSISLAGNGCQQPWQ